MAQVLITLQDKLRANYDQSDAFALTLLHLAEMKFMQLGSPKGFAAAARFVENELTRLQELPERPIKLLRLLNDIELADLVESITAEDVAEFIDSQNTPSLARSLTPQKELAELMVSLSNALDGEGSSIYLPDETAIRLLPELSGINVKPTCEIQAQRSAALVAAVSILLEIPLQISVSNPLIEPSAVAKGGLQQFERCIAFPPIGQKINYEDLASDLFGRFKKEETGPADIAWCRHILAQTSGHAVVVVSPKLLFSLGKEKAFRRSVTQSGRLKAVVGLPNRMVSGATIAMALLVFGPTGQQEKILFVDGRKMQDSGLGLPKISTWLVHPDTADVTYSRWKKATSIEEQDFDWQPQSYVLSDELKELHAVLDEGFTRSLDEIAIVIRSPLPKAGEGVEALELRSAEVADLGPTPIASKSIEIGEFALKHALQANDIVLVAKGAVGNVGYIRDVHSELPSVTNQSLYIIRCKDQANSNTLFSYLRSRYGQTQLQNIATGVSIRAISIRDLRSLTIPFFIPDDLKGAEERIREEWRLADEIFRLRKKQQQLKDNAWPINDESTGTESEASVWQSLSEHE